MVAVAVGLVAGGVVVVVVVVCICAGNVIGLMVDDAGAVMCDDDVLLEFEG